MAPVNGLPTRLDQAYPQRWGEATEPCRATFASERPFFDFEQSTGRACQ
jgi:hypothetical protein